MSKQKTKEVKLTKAGKVPKKRGRPPSKKKLYFGPEVQEAVIRYNESESNSEKNKIYAEEIHAAFDKLCENIINTFKFTYFDDPFEDVKQEVVSFLVMNMHKYDHTKGSKAFSYFSVVAKNYLILHNNNNYKKLIKTDGVDALNKVVHREAENIEANNDLINELIRYFEQTIPSTFKRKKDIDVAYAIIELMKRRHEIENFNKKALYILIREMADVDTSHITKVVNVLKKMYKKASKEYFTTGDISLIDRSKYKNPF
tara:strand:- start:11 stop:781 length:771 start_codon:yes stop_codon:yes gene_type:complete